MKRLPKTAQYVTQTPSLSALLDSLNNVVAVIDDQLTLQYLNPYWETLTGFSLSLALDHNFSAFLHPEDKDKWQQHIQNIKSGETSLLWLRLLTKQQSVKWCEIRMQSMQTDSRFPVSAIICDITPKVRLEQTQQASHRSLQSLIDRLPAMLYRARNNKSWTMEYVSEGCLSLTGLSAESMINQSQVSFGSLIHTDDTEAVWDSVQHALHVHQPFDLSYRLIRPDGKQITVQDKGQGLYSESGLVLGVEGIIFQI